MKNDTKPWHSKIRVWGTRQSRVIAEVWKIALAGMLGLILLMQALVHLKAAQAGRPYEQWDEIVAYNASHVISGPTWLGCLVASPPQLRLPIDTIARVAPGTSRSAKPPNIIEAVDFAKSVALPLVAHLTIHWSLTDAGDDPDGTLFAKLREGLSKWLHRHGIAFAA